MRKNNAFFYLCTLLITVFLFITFTTVFSYFMIRKGNKASAIKEFEVKEQEVILKDAEKLKINVYRTKTKTIEEMDIEEYIKGVVAAEMPAEFNIEALKAQAVAARTYALAHMKYIGGNGCGQISEGDICDTVHCQVYVSKEERFKTWPESKADEYWSKIEEAVLKTKEEVILYDNNIAKDIYYFAVSSGKTESSSEVFNQSVPYLQSVESTGEEVAPKFKSSIKYTYANFTKIINSHYPNSITSTNDLKNNVKIKSRTSAGGVKEIQIGKTTISGTKFRSIMGLNSTNFSFTFDGKNVDVVCKGYGHGVGMSQWGANALGKSGKDYKYIISHYYKGVEIGKYTDL